MDFSPRQVMRALQLGLDNEIKKASTMWTCFSCMTCTARCPREIDIAGIMESLRLAMMPRKANREQQKLKVFHRLFVSWIQLFGRVYEVGLAASYNLLSFRPFNKMDAIPEMLLKGKLAFFPHLAGGSKYRNIFKKVNEINSRQDLSKMNRDE
jgi:heterodisulfide reductase subunit C